MNPALTPELADRFAQIALAHLTREYPHKLDHVLDGPEDVRGPRSLHPIFFGSFDWHSCVHGYWLLLRLRRRFPRLPSSTAIDAFLDEMLVPEKVMSECSYLDRPSAAGFERPYGWAWALALHNEAERQDENRWGEALAPLAAAFAVRFASFLPRLTYPIRSGTHFNTAFASILALGWARSHDAGLAALLSVRARDYFLGDAAAPAWEPSGDDFLSPTLTEALLMQKVLGTEEFSAWFARFLPDLSAGWPAPLFKPAIVSDRSDGKIAHLDGLNLARAWCWRELQASLDGEAAVRARAAADLHLRASLPHIAGDYMGEHWLATFALLALDGV